MGIFKHIAICGISLFALQNNAMAQGQCLAGGCVSTGTNWPTGTLSTTSSVFSVVATDIWGGDYALYNVTSGNTYEWSYCAADGATCSWDSQLTLFNNSTLATICYSDDFCGDDAKIQWTATFTGVVRVKVNVFNCATNTINSKLVWRCASCATVASNCSSFTTVNCGDALTGQTTIGLGNDFNNAGSCVGFTTVGSDHYYAITVGASVNSVLVDITNIIDPNDTYLEAIWMNACSGTSCVQAAQWELADGTLTGSSLLTYWEFPVTGAGTYYLVIDSQNDGINSYDISFDCVAGGIDIDNDGCSTGTGITDTDLNGYENTWNGGAAGTIYPCQSGTNCFTIFVENPGGAEWTKEIDLLLGSCWTGVSSLTIAPASFATNGHYRGGTWTGVYNAGTNTINWDFAATSDPTWGDGTYLSGANCQWWTVCFNGTISSGCTLSNDLDVTVVVTDDGVGASGTTYPSTFNFVTNYNLGTLTVTPSTTAQTICSGSASSITLSSPATGTTYSWTVTQSGVTGASAGSGSSIAQTLTATGTSPGTATYTVTPSLAGCPGTPTVVVVTVNPQPTTSNAGPDQTICASSGNATMAANTPIVGTGTWTQISGASSTVIITTPGSPTTTITGMNTPGTYVFQWSITNSPCTASSDQITVTVVPPPTIANAGSNQTICASSGSVTMAGNTATVGTGAWTQVSGPVTGTITTPGSPTTTITGLTTAGTYVFQWSITNSPCTASTSTVTITVNAAPTTANAGSNQTICASSGSVTMAGNTATVGTGAWTQVSGPVTGTITTPGSPTTTITGLTTAGTYVFQWSITNAPCTASTSTVTITVNAAPTTANAGSNQTICASSGSVTMAGNTATVGTGAWTQVSGPVTGTITTPGSPTTTITGLTTAGTYVFQWSITNSPCTASTSTVTITVNAAPTTANAGSNQTICASSGSVTMAGNTATVGTGAWTQVSGPVTGTITTPGSPTTTITGLTTAGTYVFQWSITNAPCTASTSTVTITVNAAPTTANAGSNQTICASSGSVTMAGNTATVGTGAWTQVSGPVTGTITTPGSPTTTITGLTTAGTYVFQWSITNSPCTASTSTVTITVNNPPSIANSGSPQTICASSGSVTMAGNTPTFGSGTWTQISGPVTGTITTPSSPTTTITGLTTPGAYVFQWAITNSPCVPSTSNVTITVNAVPTTSNAGSNQTICASAGSVTMAGNAATVGTGTWTQVSGPVTGTITTPSSPTTTINGLTTAGTYVFQWTIANAPCTASSSTVSITVNPNPTFSIGTTTNPSACGASDGSITLTGLTASTTYTISYNNGSTVSLGSVTTNASGAYTITGLSSGTYSTFSVTNSFGCATVVAGPVSLVDPSSPTGTAGSTFTNPSSCGGTDGTITITGLTPSSTYNISYSNGSTIITLTGVTSNASGNYVITGLGQGTYSGFSLTLSGCTGSATGSVTLTEPPSPTFTAGSTSINPTTCGGTNGSISITGLSASTTYTITYDGPTGTVTIPSATTNASGTYVITGLGAGAYSNFVITLSGCSGTSATSVTLTDPAAPSFAAGSTSLNPTTCGGSDGTITISGLTPSTSYTMTYEGPSGVVSLGTVTTDASGNYVITGLVSGTYFNFNITNPTTGCSTLDGITSVNLTDPGAPAFTITGSGTNPTSCGATDGSFSVTGLNPSTTYDFSYDNGTVVTVTGTTDAAGNFTVTGLGAGTYTNISVSIFGCTSVNSTTITLIDPSAPTFTVSTTNPSLCGGTDGFITLSGLLPSTSYTITYDNGGVVSLGTVTTDASGNYVITGLGAGNYTNITVDLAGCVGVNSATLTITDPSAANITSVVGANPSCGANDGSITISGLTPSTTYTVNYNDGTGTITVTLTADASGNIVVGSLGAGTYTSISVTVGACTSTSSSNITLTTPTPQVANAGSDQTICGTSATMAANAVTSGTGTWTVLSGSGTFSNANSQSTAVTGLTIGTNQFIWTIVNGSCPVTSDTVSITTEAPVTTANAGLDQTLCDTATVVNIAANAPLVGSGVWSVTSGTGTIANALSDTTTVTGFTGSITLTWTISTTGVCPSSSDAVIITIENCTVILPPSGFTPGSDGVNDLWLIPGLVEQFPNNEVEIFTRWGAKIFSSKGYTTPWDGTYNGSAMPLGAYYYVINFNDGVTEPLKGTVTIIR